VVIAADRMEIITHKGTVDPESLDDLSHKWWQYWREYWNRIDSENPMPKDRLCEITIPAASE
jgi:hypothetical protein